jgi:hypothetical protein
MLKNFESVWLMLRSLEEELNHEDIYFQNHCVHMHPYKQGDWFGRWKVDTSATEDIILDMIKDVFNDPIYVGLLEHKGIEIASNLNERHNKYRGQVDAALRIEQYLENLIGKWEEI